MPRNKVFLDANILIEILESRPKNRLAIEIIEKHADSLNISALTCHIVTYVCTKRVSLEIIEVFLSDYNILSLTSEDVAWTIQNRRNKDFEDALQIATAIRSGCSAFITFDKEFAETYGDLPTLKIKLL